MSDKSQSNKSIFDETYNDSKNATIVQVLDEALPYIKKFVGKTILVKYGGNAMSENHLKEAFARDIVLLKLIGANPIVVHGGGPQIGNLLNKIGKESKFHNGMRITDTETMNAVEMVLGGAVNKEIVSLINHAGGHAVGLTGKDGSLIKASKLDLQDNQNPNLIQASNRDKNNIDLGHVGKVDKINIAVINNLIDGDFIPVIAPIGCGDDNQSYNINADLVAGEIAKAMQAEKFILLTNIAGVLNDKQELIHKMNLQQTMELINSNVISGGMLPKVDCAIDAVKSGVQGVHIIDGRVEHALILEMFTNQGIGTMFF